MRETNQGAKSSGTLASPLRPLRAWTDPHWVVLLAVPWLVLAMDSTWIYTPAGTIDPWVYNGFFRNLRQHLADYFPGTYYGSRLPWILPGFAAYSLFPDLTANFVLHLSCFYAALLSLYVTLKHTVGREAALFASLLFGSHSYFLRAIGWDYVDGAGITYYLVTCAALTKAATGRRHHVWLGLAGVAAGAMFYTYTLLGVLALPLLGYCWITARTHTAVTPPVRLTTFAGYFGAGLLVVTLVGGLASWQLTGDPWFYAPSLRFSISHAHSYAVAGSVNPHKMQGWAWLGWSTWLILPVATLPGALWTVIQLGRKGRPKGRDLFATFFAGNLLWVWFIELTLQLRGLPELQYWFKVSRLLPPTYLFLGCYVGMLLRRANTRQVQVMLISTMGAFLLLLSPFVPNSYQVRSVHPVVIVGVLAGSLGTCLPLALRDPRTRVGVLMSGLWLACYCAGRPWLSNATMAGRSFERITRSSEAVRRASRVLGRPRFWYDARAPRFGREFTSVASTYLWAFSLVNTRFPSLEDTPLDQLHPGQFVVILSEHTDALRAGRESFQAMDLSLSSMGVKAVCEGTDCFFLTFCQVAARGVR